MAEGMGNGRGGMDDGRLAVESKVAMHTSASGSSPAAQTFMKA